MRGHIIQEWGIGARLRCQEMFQCLGSDLETTAGSRGAIEDKTAHMRCKSDNEAPSIVAFPTPAA
jgi:hypothetical protein